MIIKNDFGSPILWTTVQCVGTEMSCAFQTKEMSFLFHAVEMSFKLQDTET